MRTPRERLCFVAPEDRLNYIKDMLSAGLGHASEWVSIAIEMCREENGSVDHSLVYRQLLAQKQDEEDV